MASTFFSSNYRQYKQDTEYIAGWLAERAKKAGYKRCPQPQQQQQPTTRLKGRARKEARDAAAAKKTVAATYLINVGEFV